MQLEPWDKMVVQGNALSQKKDLSKADPANGTLMERVKLKAIKFLLHPTTRKVTDFCSTAADIMGDLQRFQNPVGLVLGSGAFLEAWAERLSPSGNSPAIAYLTDIMNLEPAQHLPIARFMTSAKIRALPGLREISRDKKYTGYEYTCGLGRLWFVLDTVTKSEENKVSTHSAVVSMSEGGSVLIYAESNADFDNLMAISKEILRGSLVDVKGRKSRLLEVVDGQQNRLQLAPVTADLSHTDFDKTLEVAEDISAKRRAGRSPAYIFDGPGGTGKTTFAMAVGEMMGGMTLIMGPSALGNNTLGVIVDSLSPDIVIIDDFDKAGSSTRNQFYTTMLNLRSNHPNIAWFLTTNNAAGLGAPLLRPGRGGVLRPFRAPSAKERTDILIHNGMDPKMAEWVGSKLPNDMTHDWIVYLAQEIKQSPKKFMELTRDWGVNWRIANGEGRAALQDFDSFEKHNGNGQMAALEGLVKALEAGGFDGGFSPPSGPAFGDAGDNDLDGEGLPTPLFNEHDFDGECYCQRISCGAYGPTDGDGPCFGMEPGGELE